MKAQKNSQGWRYAIVLFVGIAVVLGLTQIALAEIWRCRDFFDTCKFGGGCEGSVAYVSDCIIECSPYVTVICKNSPI